MSKTDWVNENKNRLYPFEAVGAVDIGALELPRELVVDAGFILGIRAEADATAQVWLYTVKKLGTSWTLTFKWRPTSDSTSTYTFLFSITGGNQEGDTIFVDASLTGTPDADYGTAFLVVGDVTTASDAPDGSYVQTPSENSSILPGLVQTLKNQLVRRIHLANDLGPTFLECPSDPQPAPAGACKAATVMARDLEGDVRIRVGYNSKVSALVADGRLVFGSSIGAGEGVPCSEVSRYPGGEIPEAPTCEGLVYMINGVGPNDEGYFQIVAGKGFKLSVEDSTILLTPDPNAFCTDLWDEGSSEAVYDFDV